MIISTRVAEALCKIDFHNKIASHIVGDASLISRLSRIKKQSASVTIKKIRLVRKTMGIVAHDRVLTNRNTQR